MQGSTDIALNNKGRVQADLLRARFVAFSIQAVYCSQLRRSRQTAEIIAAGKPVIALAELNERSLGKYEGEILDRDDWERVAEFRRRCIDPDDDLDGGESYLQHRARIEKVLKKILRQHCFADQLLIIGHGGTNQIILQVLLDLPISELGKYSQQNTDVCLIDLRDKSRPEWKKISWPP
jgi:probable phosphoglycerate mutase